MQLYSTARSNPLEDSTKIDVCTLLWEVMMVRYIATPKFDWLIEWVDSRKRFSTDISCLWQGFTNWNICGCGTDNFNFFFLNLKISNFSKAKQSKSYIIFTSFRLSCVRWMRPEIARVSFKTNLNSKQSIKSNNQSAGVLSLWKASSLSQSDKQQFQKAPNCFKVFFSKIQLQSVVVGEFCLEKSIHNNSKYFWRRPCHSRSYKKFFKFLILSRPNCWEKAGGKNDRELLIQFAWKKWQRDRRETCFTGNRIIWSMARDAVHVDS